MRSVWAFLILVYHTHGEQQALSNEELQQGLESEKMQQWVQSIAEIHQVSTDDIRSQVQAIRITTEPEIPMVQSEVDPDKNTSSAIHRRDDLPYPAPPFRREDRNDEETNNRILFLHDMCARQVPQPDHSPHMVNTPGYISFYRAASATCLRGNRIKYFCRLPNEYGPPRWTEGGRTGVYHVQRNTVCPRRTECHEFNAFNFFGIRPGTFASCDVVQGTSESYVAGGVTYWVGEIEFTPAETEFLYSIAETVPDHNRRTGPEVKWTFYPGFGDTLYYSKTNRYALHHTPIRTAHHNKPPQLRFERLYYQTTVIIWYILTKK
ncbi:unnamed protein product [Cercospora beticola]|nr:unnamed protein product [Cercospora beticola]